MHRTQILHNGFTTTMLMLVPVFSVFVQISCATAAAAVGAGIATSPADAEPTGIRPEYTLPIPDETAGLRLALGGGAWAAEAAAHRLILTGGGTVPAIPSIGFAETGSAVDETTGMVQLPLEVVGTLRGVLSVNWLARLLEGQAEVGEYRVSDRALPTAPGAFLMGTVAVSAGAMALTVMIHDDALQELTDGEELQLVLRPGAGYNLGGSTEYRLIVREGVCDRTVAARLSADVACETVDSAALAALSGQLDLSSAALTALTATDLAELRNLRQLDLSNNQLTSLPMGVFDELTALEQLKLNNNGLLSLPSGVFDRLGRLTSLDLSGNADLELAAGILDRYLTRSVQELRLPMRSMLSARLAAGESPVAGSTVRFDVSLDRALPFVLEVPYSYRGSVAPLLNSGRVRLDAGETLQSISVALPADAVAGSSLTLQLDDPVVFTVTLGEAPASAAVVATTLSFGARSATAVVGIGSPITQVLLVRAEDVVSERTVDRVSVPIVVRNLPAGESVSLQVTVSQSPTENQLLRNRYAINIGDATDTFMQGSSRGGMLGGTAFVANLSASNNTATVADVTMTVAEIGISRHYAVPEGDRLTVSINANGVTTAYMLQVAAAPAPTVSFASMSMEVEEGDRTVMVPVQVTDLPSFATRLTIELQASLVAGMAAAGEYQVAGMPLGTTVSQLSVELSSDGTALPVLTVPVQLRDDREEEALAGETVRLVLSATTPQDSGYNTGTENTFELRVLEGVCERTAAVADRLTTTTRATDCYRVDDLSVVVSTLDLQGLGLTQLMDTDLRGLQQVRILSLDRNGLTTLTAPIFADLDALTGLILTENPSLSLPAGVFDGVLDTLTTLLWDMHLRAEVQLTADGDHFVLQLAPALPMELRVPYTLSAAAMDETTAVAIIMAGRNRAELPIPGPLDTAGTVVTAHLGELHSWRVWAAGAESGLSVQNLIQPLVGDSTSLTVPDAMLPRLSFGGTVPAQVTEGTAVTVTVTLDAVPPDDLSVSLAVAATPGAAYTLTATSGTLSGAPGRMLTFPAGTGTAILQLMADEDDDTQDALVQLQLTADTMDPARWQLGGTTRILIRLVDNDRRPGLSFADVRSAVDEDAGMGMVGLEATGLAAGATVEVVLVAQLESGAAAAMEYTVAGVAVPAGAASDIAAPTTGNITVVLTGDGTNPYQGSVAVGVTDDAVIEATDGERLHLHLQPDAAYTLLPEPTMGTNGFAACEIARSCHSVTVREGVCDRTTVVAQTLAGLAGTRCFDVDARTLNGFSGTLELSAQRISTLQAADFAGLGTLAATGPEQQCTEHPAGFHICGAGRSGLVESVRECIQCGSRGSA